MSYCLGHSIESMRQFNWKGNKCRRRCCCCCDGGENSINRRAFCLSDESISSADSCDFLRLVLCPYEANNGTIREHFFHHRDRQCSGLRKRWMDFVCCFCFFHAIFIFLRLWYIPRKHIHTNPFDDVALSVWYINSQLMRNRNLSHFAALFLCASCDDETFVKLMVNCHCLLFAMIWFALLSFYCSSIAAHHQKITFRHHHLQYGNVTNADNFYPLNCHLQIMCSRRKSNRRLFLRCKSHSTESSALALNRKWKYFIGVCFGQIHQTINYFIYSLWNAHNTYGYRFLLFPLSALLAAS